VFAFDAIGKAFERMETNLHLGKIVAAFVMTAMGIASLHASFRL
jgi:hypothetical protein